MKVKIRKLTIALTVLALLVWLIPQLASHADATCKTEPKLVDPLSLVLIKNSLRAESCITMTDNTAAPEQAVEPVLNMSTMCGVGNTNCFSTTNVVNVKVLDFNSSAIVKTTATAAGDNPISSPITGIATDTDIASDESIPASQTDIISPSPTSTVTPVPSSDTNISPSPLPAKKTPPSTITSRSVPNNNVEPSVTPISNANQLSSPAPTLPVAPAVFLPNKPAPEITIKKIWKFVLKNNFIISSGTSVILIVTVGISLFNDFKLILWYQRKKKEASSCNY